MWPKGLAFLEKASRLEPTNANILTDLAIVHLSSLNIDKATECAKKAVRIAPTNPVAQDVSKNVLSFGKGFSQLGERASRAEARPSSYADTHFIHRFKVSLKERPEIWRIIHSALIPTERVNWPPASGLTALPCMADRSFSIFSIMAMNGGMRLN